MTHSQLPPEVSNKNLFSNHYLQNLIQRTPEWKSDEHVDAFQRIKKIYKGEGVFLKGLNESQLEERFFKKIFSIIFPYFEVQAGTGTADFPDYAFFPDKDTLDKAQLEKKKKSFYINALAIGEVKKWDTELDRFEKNKSNKSRNPSFQIWLYLHETEPKWGVLSNGGKWRLYHQDKLWDYYYEIDLVTLLENDDVEAFRYFYYFFRKEAFLPSKDGEVFLDRVLKESADYAREIGDNLRENVYRAMKIIADGFFQWSENDLDYMDEMARAEVQESTMRLLYRFLFLLYAEGKGLLNLKDKQYKENSFDQIKKDIAEKKEAYLPAYTTLWNRLKGLFRLIDKGSEAFGIPRKDFYVPAYNGGLFEAERNPNLEKWEIGDTYLADAIDLLARSTAKDGKKAFVDYSTLEIRHLGSIYEGLLEYKLKVAEADLVVKREKKKREWVTLEEFNKGRKTKKKFEDFDEFDRVRAGNLYLATEKGERKATGSYYTPDYIVDYIVKNTIGPVVEEKWKSASENGESLVTATLSIKVLDPAMGSGHFLVGAIEFLAGKLLEAAQRDIESGLADKDEHFTGDWAKREVVSHCIYGVDINDLAVELAKVSLWLTTISKDRPLSFLDHRLKRGNSLIGADLEELPWHPSTKKEKGQRRLDIPKGFIKKLVDLVGEMAAIEDDTLDHIKRKEKIFERIKDTKEYDMIKTLADLRTSIYFGNEIDETDYGNYTSQAFTSNEQEWKQRREAEFAKKARDIAEKKKFFHWELEFPEIFFEEGKRKDNPGFDAVIGNPPYVNINALPEGYRESLKTIFSTYRNKSDLFSFFLELSFSLNAEGRKMGFIVPHTFLTLDSFSQLRKLILENGYISSLVDLPLGTFPDTVVKPIIVVASKSQEKRDIEIFNNSLQRRSLLPVSVVMADERYHIDIEYTSQKGKFYRAFMRAWIQPLREVIRFTRGIKTSDDKRFISMSKKDEHSHPVVRGSDIERFVPVWKGEWIWYMPDLMKEKAGSLPHSRKLFETEAKLITQRVNSSRRLIVAYDDSRLYALDTTNVSTDERNPEYSLHTLVAILNSKPINYWYAERFTAPTISGYELNQIPIRRINFTTPEPKRKALVEEGKQLYHKYLASDEMTHILDFVQKRLPRDKKGNFVTKKEQSDVVHDLLAYLAEQMIEMNKSKNTEVTGFLKWLETEIETDIETLTNKTKLKEYYELEFDELLAVLKKNKKKIPVNTSQRDFQENLRREFEKSMDKLKPLRKKIEATDVLIDQIVYNLYGLTEEEIKVVEGSI